MLLSAYETPAFTSPKFEEAKKTVRDSEDEEAQNSGPQWIKSPPLQSARKHNSDPVTKEFVAEETSPQETVKEDNIPHSNEKTPEPEED